MGINKKYMIVSRKINMKASTPFLLKNDLTIRSESGEVIIDGLSSEIISSVTTGAAFTIKDESGNVLFKLMQMARFHLAGLSKILLGGQLDLQLDCIFPESSDRKLIYNESDYQISGTTRTIRVHVLGKWFYDETTLTASNTGNTLSSGPGPDGWEWIDTSSTVIDPKPIAGGNFSLAYHDDNFTAGPTSQPSGSPSLTINHPQGNTFTGQTSYAVQAEQYYTGSFEVSESDFVEMSEKIVILGISLTHPGIYMTGSPNQNFQPEFTHSLYLGI